VSITACIIGCDAQACYTQQRGEYVTKVARDLKKPFVGAVVNTIFQRQVDGIILALPHARVCDVPTKTHRDSSVLKQVTSILSSLLPSREEVSKFVEGYSHYSVCGIKSLLDSVTMMDIDVNVNYSSVIPGKAELPSHVFFHTKITEEDLLEEL